MSTAADSLDVMLEGEEYFNAEELDEKEVLGDEDEEHNGKAATATAIKTELASEIVDGENDDLYDAAIEPSGAIDVKRESAEIQSSLPSTNNLIKQESTTYQASSTNMSGKRYCCYIGNMTWWTTDQDLQKAIETCGAFDLVDMKFYENRNNGQSKGFALGVFASEISVKKLMENLPKIKVHEQSLVVLPYTKQSLAKLEDATKRVDQARDKKPVDEKSGMPYVGSVRIGTNGTPQVQIPQINLGQLAGNLQRAAAVTPVVSSAPASLMSLNLAPPPPGTTQSSTQLQMRPQAIAPGGISIQQSLQQQQPQQLLPQRPIQQINLSAPPPNAMTQLGQAMSRPPPGFQQIQTFGGGVSAQMINTANPPPMTFAAVGRQQFQLAGGMNLTSVPPPITNVPPGSHINPNVYPSFAHSFGGMPENGNVMSESDFEDIMNRNRTVSSSAITRAVSDAAAGDYASAIETLVTAISLIRQSRVANDDRCKVLIASLQDTLNGIESKSYNSSHKRRSGRDRSRSPSDRGSSRKRHRRSRSRSRSSERYADYSRHALSRRY